MNEKSVKSLKVRPVGKVRNNVSMVVYGPSGSGKTTFSSSLPKPILYIDVNDRGTDSISDVKGIDVLEVSQFSDIEDAYWWLMKNPDKYKSVVIDTCTQLQNMIIRETIGEKKKTKMGVKKVGEWGTMSKQDWGNVSAILKEWLGNFRDLTEEGLTVLFIAQDRVFNVSEDDDAPDYQIAPEVGPALSPSVAKFLNASVLVIGNTFIRERKVKKTDEKGRKISKFITEYCMGIGPSSLYVRKVRKPKSYKVPEVLVDPEYQDIREIIEGK